MRMVSQTYGLRANYYALYLSILKKLSVTQACVAMEIYPNENQLNTSHKKRNTRKLSNKELEEIIDMKSNGVTWIELGEEYGMDRKTLFNKVKRYMGNEWKNRDWRG